MNNSIFQDFLPKLFIYLFINSNFISIFIRLFFSRNYLQKNYFNLFKLHNSFLIHDHAIQDNFINKYFRPIDYFYRKESIKSICQIHISNPYVKSICQIHISNPYVKSICHTKDFFSLIHTIVRFNIYFAILFLKLFQGMYQSRSKFGHYLDGIIHGL